MAGKERAGGVLSCSALPRSGELGTVPHARMRRIPIGFTASWLRIDLHSGLAKISPFWKGGLSL